jgi:hypothetical protein
MSVIDIPTFSQLSRTLQQPQPASIDWDRVWSGEIQNSLHTVKAGAAAGRHFSEDKVLHACWWNWFQARILLCEILENMHQYSNTLKAITGWISHRDHTPGIFNVHPYHGIVLDVPTNLPSYSFNEMIDMFFHDTPEMLPHIPYSARDYFGIGGYQYNEAMAAIESLHGSIALPPVLRNLKYKYYTEI